MAAEGRRRRFVVAGVVGLLVVLVAAWIRSQLPAADPLPAMSGCLVYESDAAGRPLLYVRDLASGVERRLTSLPEGTTEPAVSPDGRQVAFVAGDRLGVVDLQGPDIRLLTLGGDGFDGSPAWYPDGQRLVITRRRDSASPTDLEVLTPGPTVAEVGRHALTQTPGETESSPAVSPDGRRVVFVRAEQVYAVDLIDGTEKRLTSGMRRRRAPRFLPSGALVFPFTDDKEFGIELLEPGASAPVTLSHGTASHALVTPGPRGLLFAEFSYDTSAGLADVLRIGSAGEIRVLDGSGVALGTLARSWWHGYHAPVYVPACGAP